jgi:hypothetical protein
MHIAKSFKIFLFEPETIQALDLKKNQNVFSLSVRMKRSTKK